MYCNPFHLQKYANREDCLLDFAEYWYSPEKKWLRDAAVHDFAENEILGCWCHPLLCHGDIEAGYVNWKRHPVPPQEIFDFGGPPNVILARQK
jgi:hypothetical protein